MSDLQQQNYPRILAEFSLKFRQVVGIWDVESLNYGYSELSDGGKNYSALTWSNSTIIGCAVVECPLPLGQFFKCFLGPRGNYPGHLPYKSTCQRRDPFFDCQKKGPGIFSDGCNNVTCFDPVLTPSKRQTSCSVGCVARTQYNYKKWVYDDDVYVSNWHVTRAASSGSMTLQICQSFCSQNGYTYSGLSGYNCLCGSGYGERSRVTWLL